MYIVLTFFVFKCKNIETEMKRNVVTLNVVCWHEVVNWFLELVRVDQAHHWLKG